VWAKTNFFLLKSYLTLFAGIKNIYLCLKRKKNYAIKYSGKHFFGEIRMSEIDRRHLKDL